MFPDRMQSHKIPLVIGVACFTFLFLIPVVAHGQPLIVCNGPDCSVAQFVELVQKFINFVIFVLAVPVAAFIFGYGGVLLITARGDKSQVDKAKLAFRSAGVGLIIILAAWLIVYTIVETLIDPTFDIPNEVELEP